MKLHLTDWQTRVYKMYFKSIGLFNDLTLSSASCLWYFWKINTVVPILWTQLDMAGVSNVVLTVSIIWHEKSNMQMCCQLYSHTESTAQECFHWLAGRGCTNKGRVHTMGLQIYAVNFLSMTSFLSQCKCYLKVKQLRCKEILIQTHTILQAVRETGLIMLITSLSVNYR